MGKLVEEQAKKRGHEIPLIISPIHHTTTEDLVDKNIDVVIDFSVPEIALENLTFYAKNNIKVIMATTGRYAHIDEVKSLFQNSQGALLWSSNFAL
jgi:4-hydroxy-tetrahydrodipicolinate reductase